MRLFAGLALAILTSPLNAQGIDATEPADILAGWSDAVVSGDTARIDAVLAPEFQILRASGAHLDHEGYVDSDLPRIAEPPTADILQTTQDDGIMVISYLLTIEATVDGQAMTRVAPRLTVFRQIEGAWYVVSHANFGAVGAQ